MLKRKVYEDLLKWKKKANGKALCIIGARQIGKTTLIREFGKNEYEHFAELNFVTDQRAADIFNDKLTAETIITNLTAYLQTPLEPGKTLILFDEVQECPRVRSAIKFLVEDGRFDYMSHLIRLALNRFYQCIRWILRNICGRMAYRIIHCSI